MWDESSSNTSVVDSRGPSPLALELDGGASTAIRGGSRNSAMLWVFARLVAHDAQPLGRDGTADSCTRDVTEPQDRRTADTRPALGSVRT